MQEMSFQAFTLLKFSSATLKVDGRSYSGLLELKSVSVGVGEGASDAQSNQEFYLVLQVDGHDTPIDPSRPIKVASTHDGNSYTLGTADGRTATLLLPTPSQNDTQAIEDQDTFHEILSQYTDFQEPAQIQVGRVETDESTRGRVFFVDENTGQVVGELDHKFQIKEDPALGLPYAENDPVVIEIVDENTEEAFARVVPPEERDWITSSATFVSRAISGTTRLILTTIASASDYYIGHSSPHSTVPSADNDPSPTSQRVLMFFTSKNTQKGLSTVHSLSAQAATVSSETVGLIQNMVKRMVGGKRKSPVLTPAPPPPYTTANSLKPPLPHRTPSPLSPRPGCSGESTKPPLPPRKDPPVAYSRTPSPRPPVADTPTPPGTLNPSPLSMPKRLLLSLDMILSTMDSSVKQIVSVSGDNLTRVVEHKYGSEAARSAGLAAGTTKNIVAVYLDMRDVGRRAIIKMVGREYVVARIDGRTQ
ncbi:senescence-associated protein-domain-containing protein [Pisolithus marmoratus]|nr:senescence-associated protein-domain-containing protein [Pisolithus marmoratus]